MTYTLDFALALGSGKAGIADLRAQLVDTTGASVGAAVSTGFVEIGAGNYLWHYTSIPDGQRGGVKFYSNATPATVLAFGALNPEEAEYVDAKTSSRLAPTTPGNTLDVTATGTAGIDWGNIENKSTTVDLANTAVGSVGSVVGAVSVSVLNAAGVMFSDNQTLDMKLPALITAVGAPVALDSGSATIAGMLTKLADDNGGATFDATTDSQNKLATNVADVPTVAEFETRTLTAALLAKQMALLNATPSGTVAASPAPSATVFTTNLTETTADHYKGAFCVFASGVLLGQSRKIAGYDGTDKIITTSAFTEAPGAGDAFLILGRSE